MINSLWISKTGMEAQQTQLDVISHNLANVSTNGYKRATAVFEDLMYQNLRQVGANSTEQSQLPTGLQLGLGVRTVATSRSFTQGSMQQTNNQLDVAVKSNGFFQVTQPDGTIGYTRDGSFQVDAQGRLVTSSGLPVANGITVPPNAISVSIATDGTVSAQTQGTPSSTIGRIKLASATAEDRLVRSEDGLFRTASLNPLATDATARLETGALEGSNVNPIETMVGMIAAARQFEQQMRLLQTAETSDKSAAQLLNVG